MLCHYFNCELRNRNGDMTTERIKKARQKMWGRFPAEPKREKWNKVKPEITASLPSVFPLIISTLWQNWRHVWTCDTSCDMRVNSSSHYKKKLCFKQWRRPSTGVPTLFWLASYCPCALVLRKQHKMSRCQWVTEIDGQNVHFSRLHVVQAALCVAR